MSVDSWQIGPPTLLYGHYLQNNYSVAMRSGRKQRIERTLEQLDFP